MTKFISKLMRLRLFSVSAVAIIMSYSVSLYTGDLGVDKFSIERLVGIFTIVLLFVFTLFLIDSVDSVFKAKHHFCSETRRIKTRSLWISCYTNPIPCIIILIISVFGIANAQDLSELYRITIHNWYDHALWQYEKNMFASLQGSMLDIPSFWDYVYFLLWCYLMLVYSILYKCEEYHLFALLCVATIISFFLTRFIALEYPTAGPVFHQPQFFEIEGTTSGKVQKMLIEYMAGGIQQNGFIPGTMGMPSLHIGLTVMATWALAQHARWTLWLTTPWLCLVWLSTIMLGWHYALDGVGGIIVAFFSIIFASVAIKCEGLLTHKLLSKTNFNNNSHYNKSNQEI